MHNPGSNDTKEATLPKLKVPQKPKTKIHWPCAGFHHRLSIKKGFVGQPADASGMLEVYKGYDTN